MRLDLASLASIRAFTDALAERADPPLKAIVCNAGIQVVSGLSHTEDGFETTFGVNHLGHFLLVNRLLKRLVTPARVVFVASGTHDPAQRTGMPVPVYTDARTLAHPAPGPEANPGEVGRQRYTTSKLCNVLCTYELARRLETAGLSTPDAPVTVNAFDPGLMPGSGLARDYSPLQRFAWNFVLPVLRWFMPNVNTTEASGQALARLVTDPALAGVSGRYFEGRREIRSSQASYDEAVARALWDTSAELVALQPDETPLPQPAPAAGG
jgi:NAD(P)-dependent dehydrogenase (short-subunit alcohol dehydrogenase family)